MLEPVKVVAEFIPHFNFGSGVCIYDMYVYTVKRLATLEIRANNVHNNDDEER